MTIIATYQKHTLNYLLEYRWIVARTIINHIHISKNCTIRLQSTRPTLLVMAAILISLLCDGVAETVALYFKRHLN